MRNTWLLALVYMLLMVIPYIQHLTYASKDKNIELVKNIEEKDNNTAVLLKEKATRSWTFMVYMDGDNNLEEYAIDDFLEMSSVGSTSDVAIVVLLDRYNGSGGYGGWTDARIFYVDRGETPSAINADEVWGEVNMGDSSTLIRFINYSITNYPAQHYALVLWDHGGGFLGVCWDDTSGGDNLNLDEIRYALKTIYAKKHIKIDLLGFDACLMGLMETIYYVRDYVDYVVFSQEYELVDGWPYEQILSNLVSNPSMTPASFASVIVDEYIDFYGSPLHNDENATLSAINVTYFVEHAYPRINRLTGFLLRYYSTYSGAVSYAINNAEDFYYTYQKDLKHFLLLLRSQVTDSTLIALINETIEAIENSIVDYGHLTLHPNAYGVSAYFPEAYVHSIYSDLECSEHQQWDEFIKKYVGYNPGIWFYDIQLFGLDTDIDGYLDSNIKLMIDLDTETPNTIYVKVYARDNVSEELVGQSNVFTIDAASSSDAINVSINVSGMAEYDLRVEICDQDDRLIKGFYYCCDEDLINVRLESLNIVSPSIQITYPSNYTFHNTSTLMINWTSSIADIDHFEVFVDGVLMNDSIPSDETYYVVSLGGEGEHTITVCAIDKVGNRQECMVIVIVDMSPPEINVEAPANNSTSATFTIEFEINVSDKFAVERIEIHVDGELYLTLGPENRTFSITFGSTGTHVVDIVAYDKAGNRSKVSIKIDIVTGEEAQTGTTPISSGTPTIATNQSVTETSEMLRPRIIITSGFGIGMFIIMMLTLAVLFIIIWKHEHGYY